MKSQTFKYILHCWTWSRGERFRRRFDHLSIGSMAAYGRGGVNHAYYGITAEGKRVKLPKSFTYTINVMKDTIEISD